MAENNLHCWVYRSPRKQEMYLYLAGRMRSIPCPLASWRISANPFLVIELELSPDRQLAREDVNRVMANLREQGFHLQMPPKLQPELYHGNLD